MREEGRGQSDACGEQTGEESSHLTEGFFNGRGSTSAVPDHVAILTSAPGPRTMDPKEIPAVPCFPSNSEYTTVFETRTPQGMELGPRRAVGRCDHCQNHGITTQVWGNKHLCPFRACRCHTCTLFLEPCKVLPDVSTLQKEQKAQLKKHLTQGPIRTVADPPKAQLHVENLTTGTGVLTKKESFVPQPEVHPPKTFKEAAEAAGQASAHSEWQRKLEAAEALLSLKNSCPAPSVSISMHQPCSPPAFETGAPRGMELGPRGAVDRCDLCHSHGITTQIRGHRHFCLFQACVCHNCALSWEPWRVLPDVSALQKEQEAELKKLLAQGLIKTVAASPNAQNHMENLATEAGVLTGKESLMPQPETRPPTTPKEQRSKGAVLLSQPPELLTLPRDPTTWEQQQMASLPREPCCPPALPGICSAVILHPCASHSPLLQQPQFLVMVDPRDKALRDYYKKLLEHKEIDGHLKELREQ
ncbi:Doublesex- and mab-3-related transcription factor C2 [Tupaia chinensis]|uniref:Doublesex-and mab-3-related transcription factor C2 n=1 Tax=Tupaia chinensis TaxID=246437 RepID=L8Y2Z2_TUPCH|nr:Doublesex- and mab-3-related transcription factor C2 [Tupaia chinensis]